MQLQRIRIGAFRNLDGVEIIFNTHFDASADNTPGASPKAIRSHAFIGENGTGKSNLIEALITIFRDVDLDREAAFDYELHYSMRGRTVEIKANLNRQRRPFVWVDGKAESQGYILRNRELLPSHIFAYYSGRNERMEELFQEHQRRFNRRQEITAEEVLPEDLLRNFTASESDIRTIEGVRKREENKTLRQFGDDRLRRLFYCRGGHSQLVLLACLLSDDPVFKKVLAKLHIESLESALFVLKQPHHLRELKDEDILQGDPRFWYARGNVVTEFLDKLWQVAWAPIEHETTKLIDFRGRREKQKQLYLFISSQEKLRRLGDLVGTPDSFFRYAEGAYIGDLIDEVRITVKKRDPDGGRVSFTLLSEGELQMLTVLGLMRITSADNCLFLLDEPDTHLNPIWKLRYFEEIENILASDESAIPVGESQVIITTHDPLMIGSLRREQVRILRREQGRSIVEMPAEHPQGMGVAGLLKSDMFGLASTLDLPTLELLQERNDLLAKKGKSPLSTDQESRLSGLRLHLGDLGFSHEQRDPLYQLFIQKMYEVRSRPLTELLSPEEVRAQDQLAQKVITELVKKERVEELSAVAKELKVNLES